MNINLLKNNPTWWWYVLVVGVVLFLALLGWIIFKYIKVCNPALACVRGFSAQGLKKLFHRLKSILKIRSAGI
jgi:hypothetical protein